ncbi:putative endo-beta-1,4-glucanase B [Aspergillus tamarii]|uniref:cellulase n=1 Tax=Aspergillus tamarii TaxID=41984 RepID=A0A5N6VA70_ASPTM|nr:putative endo-beta-1,4-glucanase B [Aspergillus tamarii]
MRPGILVLVMTCSAAGGMAEKSLQKKGPVFQWFGSNESGAEFGEKSIPGTYGADFTFPDPEAISTLAGKGMNIFRIGFLMERLVLGSVTGSFDDEYLHNLTTIVDHVTSAGAYAVLDPHNYGRYNGQIITATSDFETFWKNVAGRFKSNSQVIFDTNNEYHDMDQDLVLKLNQAAIDGIRGAGATEQYIFVEGNSYTGAWKWAEVNDNLKNLNDPQNKIVYEMHQYLDADGSGTAESCVSDTIGEERLTSATKWLKDNKKVGVLGEFAGGVNDQCRTAITGMLKYLAGNTDVWKELFGGLPVHGGKTTCSIWSPRLEWLTPACWTSSSPICDGPNRTVCLYIGHTLANSATTIYI